MNNVLSMIGMCCLVITGAFAGVQDDLKKSLGGDVGSKVSDAAKSKAKEEGNKKIASQVNKQLLAESRKNQCSFKSGTDELAPGCNNKSKKLAQVIISVKKKLQESGHSGYKFVVSGHTDSSGDAAKNKALSLRRAQVMVKELVSQGVNQQDIEAVGMGSERMLVKPDNTAAKKAKNRRYEVQVQF